MDDPYPVTALTRSSVMSGKQYIFIYFAISFGQSSIWQWLSLVNHILICTESWRIAQEYWCSNRLICFEKTGTRQSRGADTPESVCTHDMGLIDPSNPQNLVLWCWRMQTLLLKLLRLSMLYLPCVLYKWFVKALCRLVLIVRGRKAKAPAQD